MPPRETKEPGERSHRLLYAPLLPFMIEGELAEDGINNQQDEVMLA